MNVQRRRLDESKRLEIERAIQNPQLPLDERAALRLKLFLENEEIIKMPGEKIPAWRTLIDFPDIYAPGERERLQQGHYVHEQGRVCNISPDWEGVLKGGLMPRREITTKASQIAIDAVLDYADRYGDAELSDAVRFGAKDYPGALKMFRILHFALWASNVYHNTVGRFDQYMLGFLETSMNDGMTRDEALEWTREFFLSFNRDSDLYQGMQQGDNGQSMMLGGCDKDGLCAVNVLTHICLEASLINRRIDPKINLRVNKDTPIELYEKCTEMTKQGLGFPQYANDDVVIPALVDMGYDIEDARNYVVAACWEFIIPGVAMDIPNIGAIPLASAVNDVIRGKLLKAGSFEELKEEVARHLRKLAIDELERVGDLFLEPAPYQTVLMSDVRRDISEGAKYNNYGFHGTGFATAVDQLAAVKYAIFDEKLIDKKTLLDDLDGDFKDDAKALRILREDAPKLGRDDVCEDIAEFMLSAFADAVKGLKNERGGIVRAGTGSAMYYLWHAADLPTTADGRLAGEKLSANFSPSLLLRDAGPLSVIQAMARPGLKRVMNGGPLTLEMHSSVFKHPEGLTKVAQLVKSFIALGGHQLQLNAVNREELIAAQKDPQAHQNLIVRVWGWSGHFVQLDKSYQDQIIERATYGA
ncbi:MAG: pyruvate formate lyase family protein [Clostridia bacterium]|nr:pyruvate formate lyase family protein [Clostridia bacterium]